ncbi:MAG TPA: DUF423 domain-containing protein [Bacteroidetes bacterium]|nr:DUF423 domain-containing protein [Bacteroidota bacterium]
MKNQRTILTTACVFASLAVILGAFGAHTLKEKISPELLLSFETGVRYQFYHALALLLLGILIKDFQNRFTKWAAIFFTAGIIFFCGSIYILSIRDIIGLENYKWLGPITPLGGVCFIIGWASLLLSVRKK